MYKKKLLVLGAGEAQLQIIKSARKCGLYTIVCDERTGMEGTEAADKHYRVNYMDRDAILHVAQTEKIDGVISNSEPAMINVAWLSEKLGLPGNSEVSIKTLLSKTKFRDLQAAAHVFAPRHRMVRNEAELLSAVSAVGFPLVVKPVLSSGTRGTAIVKTENMELVREAFRACMQFSRNQQVSIEEYVPMQTLTAYDAEIFVCGEEILWDGLYASFRTKEAPLLPMMEALPLDIRPEEVEKIKKSITTLIHEAGIRLGEYNAETYFTPENEVFVIEINPRQGGNHIPDLVKEHSGIDFTELLCLTAVGDRRSFSEAKEKKRRDAFVTMYVVFSFVEGTYKGLAISETIKPFVRWMKDVVQPGERVHEKRNAGDAVAYVRMTFPSSDQQKLFMKNISAHISPIVE